MNPSDFLVNHSFLPHQEYVSPAFFLARGQLILMDASSTEKSPGMFATIIIVLLSSYSGGQVHVSHSASSHLYDLAPSSASATSVLAWYTDVIHEVKPITSGYCLALSYNLIHTSQEFRDQFCLTYIRPSRFSGAY